MGSIKLEHINKTYGKDVIIPDLNLEIEDGSFTVLVGPSGCGKSTTLRMIAGLETPSSGRIFIDDTDIGVLPPGKRDIAMVFQNYALYPTMTVRQNIEFGLENKKIPKEERRKLVEEISETVGLTPYLDRKPSKLSGGQRQRVALARAMVKKPKVFLMDEPLSNLDAKLRTQMRVELIQMHERLKTTFVYVTHDQVEAMSMGDNIILMDKGIIMQRSAPTEMYQNPQNVYTARFIGTPPMNILQNALPDGYQLGFRPERVLFERPEGEPAFRMNVHVVTKENLGSECIYSMTCDFGAISVKSQDDVMERDVTVYVKYSNLYIFDAESNRAPLDETVRRQVEEISARVREGR
ncbi:ABC transporter ATP-binding protein [Enterocloster asparagiformis]|jgi:sn-glycerol 3-phosphate transport system ATP-binding protein|uniref:ABC transporter ATP-binding protein n=1 Tax=Enterocloster asparagiformis TaxID=333367 RepID=A0A413FGM0_9FIRM|nr:ABC transporter ATP-binding protein [Enterocloster asparagiformis]RGX29933.1 ABC transporter ATP-binding protein [Enterocloster asparagiformis]